MLQDIIENFPNQFSWEPKVENGSDFKPPPKIIVLGMGGSHLAADLLKTWSPFWSRVLIHSDYGLPDFSDEELKKYLIIASSHSGNTEEVVDGLKIALEKNLTVAIVASSGQLIKIAQEKFLPYVALPADNIQPRLALGYSLLALLKLMGEEKTLAETKELAQTLKTEELKKPGKSLAEKLQNKIPIIYSSSRKQAIALNWKIKFNETAKIPAWANFIPELNHNEMAGFDVVTSTKNINEKFFFIILADKYDHTQNQKRMKLLADLLQKRNFPVEIINLAGQNHWHKIFSALVLADWTSLYLAQYYSHDPDQVPLVEEFKNLIA